jgi:protein-tyrosine kinase
MNKHTSIKPKDSLLERAADLYDFGAAFRNPGSTASPVPSSVAMPLAEPAMPAPAFVQEKTEAVPPAQRTYAHRAHVSISREHLATQNLIIPDGPVTGLSEEFRIVKRQLLLAARGSKGVDVVAHGERILVCSANPDEGKTYCATNLALSMASEKDNRVLLIDADFAKPSVLTRLGIDPHPGFMDALADSSCDVESLVLTTDIDGLSVLPAGSRTNQDTEYLAASRTADIIDQLTRNDPSRIIIFDSPPALAASPASVLALHVGQILMVVHADVTTDSALRDALNLLSGCEHVQLLLNRTKFSPTGRKFGNYYGYGAS